MAKAADHTLDAFHRGAFWLVQPKGTGHRAGMDAMMLAASVPSSFAGKLADFGAGAGAAGLAVATRCPQAQVTLIEKEPAMAAFAERTLAYENNGRLAPRATVAIADVALTGKRRAAVLADRGFDFVIMNPPFNSAAHRAPADDLKRTAHVMDDTLFEDWIRTTAAVVKPRGGLAVIARPQSLAAILVALAGRFGAARILPIHPRPEQSAIRIVVRATRAARGALSLEPPLVMHEADGDRFSARADAICNGQASLFGD